MERSVFRRCEDIVIEVWNADMADERRASLTEEDQ